MRGDTRFNFELGPPPYTAEAMSKVLFGDWDILTPGTAGQIAALNRAIAENCQQ